MIFFLGSGVSLASGLPSVMEISDQLLNGNYFHDPEHASAYSGAIRPVIPITSGHPYRFDPAGVSIPE